MIKPLLLIIFLYSSLLFAQKSMTPEVYDIWNTIEDPIISGDGKWMAFILKPGDGDPSLKLYEQNTSRTISFSRASKPSFSYDGSVLVFTLHPYEDSVKAMRRKKVKKEDLPKDTLGIYHLENGELTKIPRLNSYQLPGKWSGYLAYQYEPEKDSTNNSKEKGFPLVLHEYNTGREDTFLQIHEYLFAKEAPKIMMSSVEEGKEGLYVYDTEDKAIETLLEKKGDYKQLTIHDDGSKAAFLVDVDTTKAQIRNYQLYYWSEVEDVAQVIADSSLGKLPDHFLVSQHAKPNFSKDGTRLFFGVAPKPFVKDTTLLEEEIVQVEVWTYQDGRLYTQQESRAKASEEKSYLMVYNIEDGVFTQLGSEDIPEIELGNEGNATHALGYDETPYLKYISWEGDAFRDVYWIEVETGEKQLIGNRIWGNTQISSMGNYAYWYSYPDSNWMVYNPASESSYSLTEEMDVPFYDELNDRPMHPYPYGITGWIEDDEYILINDRYDIWKIDPRNPENATNLTNGRENQTRYRYIKLDPEARFIEGDADMLLHVFDETTREEGYSRLNLVNNQLTELIKDDFSYTTRPIKARNANQLVFTKEHYQVFPDLIIADTNFQSITRISEANPQQDEYNWGTIELYEWTSLDGQQLQGLLVKPENFDPSKQYPMIVNFYERSSNGLHRHRAPEPNRSTISYSYYTSRGYVIFNPDIPYKVGYPGESAFNAVVPGVTSLIQEGFIDEDRIGVQGHSWGGYQIAYLITRTNIFRCAESGAPVVNMISAYGGIRWGSGMSRMFQYERTQSRIGGTLWEYPLRYIENSPIFTVDKIQTPVLIMHNDEDTAVPWYQGIEFFVALRRLGKPAWMLNYNGEPHWPVKRQNRLDFNLRMQQFFDHYLMDARKPVWMEQGVSPLQKGIEQGYELME